MVAVRRRGAQPRPVPAGAGPGSVFGERLHRGIDQRRHLGPIVTRPARHTELERFQPGDGPELDASRGAQRVDGRCHGGRDPKTRDRFEEVTIFTKFRDVGNGVQWPFQVRRERNGPFRWEAVVDLIDVINGLGLPNGLASDLRNKASEAGKQAAMGVGNPCQKLDELLRAGRKQLAPVQLAALTTAVGAVQTKLSC